MAEQNQHGMLPRASHDELARQNFVQSFKIHLATRVSPGNERIYEQRAKARFKRKHRRAPRDRHEVRGLMTAEPYYRMWSALQRTSQEMMWDSVATSVERQLDALVARGRGAGGAGGTLTLDPELALPAYHAAVDIHCQPGGYHTELTADDVAAGAIYDRAVYIYAMGRMGPFNDDLGRSVANWLRHEHPEFKPEKILDLGCSVGHSTIPYVEAYPEAEVHGIDVAAPMLRYAHARAEALGKRIHLSQQNAERTNFADRSFDLIVSHILLHETSAQAIGRVIAECRRLLRPGGMMIHAEVPQFEGLPPYAAFMLDWDTYNNNEPFWGHYHDLDLAQLATEARFKPKGVKQIMVPSAFEQARARTGLLQGGDFGGAGAWFLFIAHR
ncbi:MAG TPA: class I SAM-dependent methyltransferase [Candidatus Binataceae bacterium]|nr:class I SAM-dependent methyltransferase [Candidatus Binataceae bacterium]